MFWGLARRWLANERMEEELLSAEFEGDDAFDVFDQPPVVEVDIHESDSEVRQSEQMEPFLQPPR
jgi:hypothetical protein